MVGSATDLGSDFFFGSHLLKRRKKKKTRKTRQKRQTVGDADRVLGSTFPSHFRVTVTPIRYA